ncbi:SO2930 family diheme c-type cytochrome [Parvularcula lutaonensis]|uniref:SO2930 family diheme c-type cytochrome n=1 Tax=Parvularcula lutaonensis TaxID=491923 RepID=A0ABV7MAH2_9PROT|nr:SO2930 family diheme c-type cytochrome [Parvularcula lutaonensis]GGY37950.1 hypothetical protein GCM10007148_02770 [Parvularcula lutaonensis]
MLRLLIIAVLVFAAACSDRQVTPRFHASQNPQLLSEWGAIAVEGEILALGRGVTPYALNTPLFTDYAHKLRTVWTMGDASPYQEQDVFALPVGTVITKTFYYPTSGDSVLQAEDLESVNGANPLDLSRHRLIETRLLVRRDDGWHPLSYIWNEAQTDAVLKRTGAVIPLTLVAEDGGERSFAYVVPNKNQCAACHATNATTKEISPIGPSAGQLNRFYWYAEGERNQLLAWAERGLIERPVSVPIRQVSWMDPEASLDARARSYLAANCAHCHNPKGPADTSGLDLTLSATPLALGRCKLPIAAGSGTGGHRYDIVPGAPQESILVYRTASSDPGAMMPELGRSLVHDEGVALLSEWISAMEGSCS